MRNAFSPRWSKFIRDARVSKGWTRKVLAQAVPCDASLITLIERDGHIPRRDMAENIGQALGLPLEAVAAAGYLDSPEQGLQRRQRQWLALQDRLPVEAINALELLSRVSRARQKEGLDRLCAYASGTIGRMSGKQAAHA